MGLPDRGGNEDRLDYGRYYAYPAGYCFPGQDPLPGDIAEFWAEGAISFSILESASSRPHRIAFYQSADQPYRFNARFVKDE